jgi:signal transduction histidine kinase
VGNGDELDRLTKVFNAMTRRLDDSFQRVREFTLHASHELKTPLTVIRHELDAALHDDFLSAAERERYARLLEEIERLAQIVDGLNFITKADAGLLTMEKSFVRLDDLVRDACDDAQVLAQGTDITVHLEGCEAIGVTGDRRRLRQLLLILTDNAIKYNEQHGRITIALRRQGGRAVLTVANTGAGIPSEGIDRVFDRFFRGDPSHNSEVEGCGLGLTIAQGIVRAHAGEISIASQSHGITTVTVGLPASPEIHEAFETPARRATSNVDRDFHPASA